MAIEQMDLFSFDKPKKEENKPVSLRLKKGLIKDEFRFDK